METIGNKFKTIWSNSVRNNSVKRNENSKCIVINRLKLPKELADEIEEFLMKEFFNMDENIYKVHISLIEFCFSQTDMKDRYESVIFLNQTFENWHKQAQNRILRRTSKNGNHLTLKCQDDCICLCSLDDNLILKAFNLIVNKVFFLMASFNKLYHFQAKIEIIKPLVEEFLVTKASDLNKFKLLCELNDESLFKSFKLDYREVTFFVNLNLHTYFV
jgi:hypothetical protein